MTYLFFVAKIFINMNSDSILSKIKNHLNKIDNSKINALVAVCDRGQVLDLAKKADSRQKSGALNGLPVVIKDNISVKNMQSTCCCLALSGNIAQKNASSVQKLVDEGAIILGIAGMDELAIGSTNATSAFGAVLNPLDNSKVPGGSSGGSAAAVAAGLCAVALGTDTGGSVRQPASYCGIFGLKPTINSIDMDGVFPLVPEYDQIGILSGSLDDLKRVFDTIKTQKFYPNKEVSGKFFNKEKKYKVGIIKHLPTLFEDDKRIFQSAIDFLSQSGHEIVCLSVPLVAYCDQIYQSIGSFRAVKNLSTYINIDKNDPSNQLGVLGQTARERIVLGEEAKGGQDFDSLLEIEERFKIQFEAIFKECDFVLTPSTPTGALRFDEDKNSKQYKTTDYYARPASIAGLPAISVPYGASSEGLPMGLQLIGGKFEEEKLFKAGRLFAL